MSSNYRILCGDCLEALDTLEPNSIDCIITDPPYGLTSITKRFGKENSAPNQYGKDGSFARLTKGFMGKEWDGSGIEYNVEMWQKCLNVLKPGGYLLAFGGTRTYHRIACAIEDAGFEIRDCIMWLYGSGFPKSLDIGLTIDKKQNRESKVVGKGKSGVSSRAYQSEATTTAGAYEIKEAQNEWKGWKTALKPAYEPIIMARKPFKGSLVDNILENNIGGLNIDECRIPTNDIRRGGWKSDQSERQEQAATNFDYPPAKTFSDGRYPANLILTYDETDYDEVCGGFPNTKSVQAKGIKRQARNAGKVFDNKNCGLQNKEYDKDKVEGYTDSGNAARYFYCAKASTRDRNEGLDTKCSHPTVKPTNLMQYLIKLVAPKGATILDPFMGSGSTGKAVAYENLDRNMDYKFIGIEKDPEYCEIAKKRIGYVANQG